MDKGTRNGVWNPSGQSDIYYKYKKGMCSVLMKKNLRPSHWKDLSLCCMGPSTPLWTRGRNVNSQLSPNEMSHLLDISCGLVRFELTLVAYFLFLPSLILFSRLQDGGLFAVFQLMKDAHQDSLRNLTVTSRDRGCQGLVGVILLSA